MNKKLYLERAQNELEVASILFKISSEKELKKQFLISKEETFFSSVISHSYYSIFYSAKAYLLIKGIKTKAPEEHKKTFLEFKKLVEKGIIDLELLKIYEKILIRADSLLEIFRLEKNKRGKYTYYKLPQSNKEPAKESMNNSKTFFKNIYNLLIEVQK